MGAIRNATRLSEDQAWTVYKYAVENRCILQNGDFWKYRVSAVDIAKEINALKIFNVTINPGHIRTAVERAINWEKKLNKLPEPQETMELEQLREQNIKDAKEIESLKLEISKLKDEWNHAANSSAIQVRKYQDMIAKAVAILAV